MQTRKSFLRRTVSVSFFVALAIFLFKSGDTAQTKQLDLNCPAPTVQKGNQCVLEGDVVLEETLELFSDTKLNCQGLTITPTHPGTGIPNNVNPRSQPEVAIFLNGGINVNGVHNIQIQNCIIDGFDFGIFAINNKIPEELKADPGTLALLRNKILRNTIIARFTPISLISFDNTEIKENTMTVTTIGGIGLYVGRNSDNNEIKNNIITADLSGTPGAVRVPGPSTTPPAGCPFPATTHCSSNPILPNSFAVSINQTFAGEPTLLNMILEGTLYQFTITDNPEPDIDFTEDNSFEGNSVSFLQARAVGLFLSISQGTKVLKNKISNATVGMQVAGIFGDGTFIQGKRQFPGTVPAIQHDSAFQMAIAISQILTKRAKGHASFLRYRT